MYVPTDDFATPEDEYQGLLARAKEAVTRRLDEIAYDMDRTYGSKRAAERLGISQQLVIRRRNAHKEKLMQTSVETHTVTEYVPVAKQEVSRTWTRKLYPEELGGAPGPWETEVDGARWVLHYNGRTHGWTTPDRRMWQWGPAGGGQEVPEIRAEDEQAAMVEATWHLDVKPLIDAAQQAKR